MIYEPYDMDIFQGSVANKSIILRTHRCLYSVSVVSLFYLYAV